MDGMGFGGTALLGACVYLVGRRMVWKWLSQYFPTGMSSLLSGPAGSYTTARVVVFTAAARALGAFAFHPFDARSWQGRAAEPRAAMIGVVLREHTPMTKLPADEAVRERLWRSMHGSPASTSSD